MRSVLLVEEARVPSGFLLITSSYLLIFHYFDYYDSRKTSQAHIFQRETLNKGILIHYLNSPEITNKSI